MLYMFLAEGFEETEAIGSLDVIRRAGIDIKTVGVADKCVYGSHGVGVMADILLSDVTYDDMDGVILPGGMPGTTNLAECAKVVEAVKYCYDNDKMIAAICAAPMIFGQLGMLRGKGTTCYPGFEKYLDGAKVCQDMVVCDGNVITGKGAGAAMLFGAAVADYFDNGKGGEILKQMQHS